MAVVCRFLEQLSKNAISPALNRNISVSATLRIKEIIEKKEGNTLTIEAVLRPDENADRVLKSKNEACVLCSTELDVKHTDVLILSQFLRPDGCMLPARLTGLCSVQQKRITTLVAMAQKAGLMPNLAPKSSKKDPKKRRQWRKFNTYYDENTIIYKYW